jgi:hypothetical protein
MKKLIILALMVGSSLLAGAVEYRQRTEVVASSTPIYPECNRVYRITEERDIFYPGGWKVVNIEVIEDTCVGVE